MEHHSKIYVAGHTGLVGSALMRSLTAHHYTNICIASAHQLDLRNQFAVNRFFSQERPEYVFLAAAKVGGIYANNTYRAEFIYDNLMINTNVINAAYQYGVQKLIFLGSSCIYPRDCAQPIKEEYLMTGPLEPTNAPYALAKIAGLELCKSYNYQYGTTFIAAMPTNLYGPGDTFDATNSHVIPALIKKIYNANRDNLPTCLLWGTGTPQREFLYVDDLAHALIFLMNTYNDSAPINVGSGQEITIQHGAELIKQIIGYQGTLLFDATRPDGTPRKLLDCHKLTALGWRATTALELGIKKTIEWYYENIHTNTQQVSSNLTL